MNRIFQKVHLIGLVALLLGFAPSQTWAQVAVYGFTGNNNSTDSWPVDAQPSNATMSNFYRGPGVNKPANPGTIGAFTSNGWTMSPTKNDSDYYQFSVKPMVGFSFRLDSIVLRELRSNTGITKWATHTSRDNYATAVQEFTVPDVNTFRNNQKTVFTGASFNNITDSIGVRFYGYAAESAAGTWRVDSVRIFGTITSGGGNPTPVVMIVPSNVAFGNILIGTSAIRGVRVSGNNLTGNVSIAASGVQISADSANFVATSPINLTATSGSVAATKVFVRVSPTAVGAISGTITASSAGAGDAVANVSANGVTNTPPPTNGLYRTIASLRGVNTDGAADSLNRPVVVTGTVHSINFRPAGLEFAMMDYTGGINVFRATNLTPAYTVTEGDSIRIRGTVAQFRGLIQIAPDSITLIAAGRSLMPAQIVTALGEVTEGRLVKMENLTLTPSSPWGGATSFTARARVGASADSIAIRVVLPATGITVARPTGAFKVTGIGYQFTATNIAPFVGGYQINPRRNSDIEAGTAVNPGTSNLYRTIASLRGVNTDGAADSLNRPVVVTGTVHSINFRPAGLEFAMMDYTGGINVFRATNLTPAYTVTEGDSIRIRGAVAQFRGLIQINPDSITLIAAGRPLMPAQVVTALGEATEGRLVKMENLMLTPSSPWGGATSFTARARVGAGPDSIAIRVVLPATGITVARPTDAFKVTGIGYQFTTTTVAPFVGGYQINPRRNSDIETAASTTPTVLAQPLVNMGTVLVGDSAVRGFRVGGMNLTADLVVSPMANVQISQDSANFVSVASINFTPVAGIVTEKRVFVKVKPMSAGIKNDTVMSMSTGANMVKTVIRTNAATAVTPGSNLYRTIASLRGVNTQGVADSLARPVIVTGTVHSINFRPAGLEFAIADYTGGIHLFRGTNVTPAYTVTEGDSIRVRGTVAQFRGLIQIAVDSVALIAAGRPLKPAQIITTLGEAEEGRLVKMENLTLTSSSPWGGATSFTARARVGAGPDSIAIRVVLPATGITVGRPTGTFKVTGIAGQFASTAAPFVGGYQINPRRDSDIEAGTVVNPPSSNLFRTIGSLRGVNAQGVPDSLNKPVIVMGTVHSINFRPVGLEFTIMDATGGIHISKSAPIVPNYVVTEGDSIRVRGTISQFRGMTIVNPDSIRIIATGRALQAPMVTTVVNESTEGKLLKMLNLTLTSNSPWGGNNVTAKAFVGTSTDTIFVRLDSDAGITVPRPAGAFNLVGIGYQFMNAAPFLGGHQINPRRNSDIEIITSVKGNVSETLKVYPNPATNFVTVATENATAQTVSVINAAGQVVISQNVVGQTTLNVNNLQSGLYIVKVTSLDGRVSQTRRISVVR